MHNVKWGYNTMAKFRKEGKLQTEEWMDGTTDPTL